MPAAPLQPRRDSGDWPRRWAPLVVLTVAAVAGGLAGPMPEAADTGGDRDWSRVLLAWRDDPRPPADLPGGGEPVATRRPSRRSQRRAAARRRTAGDDEPQVVVVESADGPGAGRAPGPIATAGSQPSVAHRDLCYGEADDPLRRFDLHLPAACQGGCLPLVVWIQGSDWHRGPKADCPIRWLVPRGYAVASVAYRPSDAALFPAQLDDCRTAIDTLRADAATWGIDPERICVVGAGAGGHLAALVGYDRGRDVAAVCTVAAPTHLVSLGPAHDRPGSAASRLVGGPLPEFREAALAASPVTHVTADAPPTLVLHGTRDASVPCAQGTRLAGALKAVGADGTLVLLDAGHDVPLGEDTPGGRALAAFLGRVIGGGPRPAAADPEPAR